MIVHPVEHDFWGPVPSRRDISGHLVLGGSSQTEVEDFQLTVFIHSYVGRLQVLQGRNTIVSINRDKAINFFSVFSIFIMLIYTLM